MRILLVHQYFLEENDAGGSRWNEMCRIWTEGGHDITVLGGMIHANGFKKRPEYKGKWFKNKKQGKVNVWRCHVSESYNTNFVGRLWGYFSFVISTLWAGFFKVKGDFDVIIVSSPPLFIGLSGLLLSKIKKTPYVFEIRDLWPESAIDTGVIRNSGIIKLAYFLESHIYNKARLINVLTPAFEKNLIDKKNIPSSKIIFIPNAADFNLSDKVLKNFDPKNFRIKNGTSGKFVITYVGAHGVANHLIQLLDVAEKLKDKPVLFQLIGGGMQKAKLQENAKNRGLSNVHFIDPIAKKDVFKYIIASDVGTSVLKKAETFKTIYSNKTFDYMACKKPVLLLIDGISRELVETADCGIYAEPENLIDIENKIRFLINNPEILNRQGENGYEYAKTHFDRIVLAEKYMNHLKEIIK
jgi:glycosyltransferase involved in cell wall biosynthesis